MTTDFGPQLSTMNLQPTSSSKPGIDATKNRMASPESFRGWPAIIKMDEAVKAKVEELLMTKFNR